MSLDLRFERLIAAPPERVFDAFTDPAGQREFYGTDAPGWVVDSRCDLRVGGVWSISFGPSRDELYHHRHVFEAIDRPRRILLTTTETRLDGSSFDTSHRVQLRAARRRHADDDGPGRLPGRGRCATSTPAASPTPSTASSACSIERRPMSNSVLYMSMSLDGFITGPDDGPGQGLGAGGEVLHGWLGDGGGDPSAYRPARAERPVFDELHGDRRRARRAAHVRHRRPLERRPPRRRPDLRPDPGRAARAGIADRVHYVTDGVESAMAPGEGGGGRRERHGARRRRWRSRSCAPACSTRSRST